MIIFSKQAVQTWTWILLSDEIPISNHQRMLFQAVPGVSTQQQHLTAQPSSEKASGSSQQEQIHSVPCETGSGIHPDCLEPTLSICWATALL